MCPSLHRVGGHPSAQLCWPPTQARVEGELTLSPAHLGDSPAGQEQEQEQDLLLQTRESPKGPPSEGLVNPCMNRRSEPHVGVMLGPTGRRTCNVPVRVGAEGKWGSL